MAAVHIKLQAHRRQRCAGAPVHGCNGGKREFGSDFNQANQQIMKAMIKGGADKCLADKKLARS